MAESLPNIGQGAWGDQLNAVLAELQRRSAMLDPIISATDSAVAAVIEDPASDTAGALTASIDQVGGANIGDVDTELGAAAARIFARPTVPSLPHPRITKVVDPMTTGWSRNDSGKISSFSNASNADNSPVAATTLRVVTDGSAGGYSGVIKTLGAAVNMTGKMFALWVKVPDNTHVTSISIIAGSGGSLGNSWNWLVAAANGTKVGFLSSGEWMLITVPWGTASVSGTPNRTAVDTFYVDLSDDGAGTPVEWYVGGLVAVAEPAAWPNGVVSLTFDDDLDGLVSHVGPKLMQYGMPATLFPITDRIGTSGHSTLEQYRRFQQIYGWDVMPHAADNTSHGDYTTATEDTRQSWITETRAWHIDNGFPTDVFAIPNGASNAAAALDMKRYFQMARGVGVQLETWPPARPMYLRSFSSQSPNNTSTALNAMIDQAIASKAWLIVVFHGITSTGSGSLETSYTNFDAFIDYIATTSIAVRTMSDVARSSNA